MYQILKRIIPVTVLFLVVTALQVTGQDISKVSQSANVDSLGVSDRYLQALERFEPWAESVWHDYGPIPGSGYFGDGATSGNGGIRGTCGIALAYAVLVRAFPGAPQRLHRLKRVEAALRYAAMTHVGAPDTAIDGKRWGVLSSNSSTDPRGWQSSLWASSMGFAAALVEKDLDPAVARACRRVVGEEADWLSKKAPGSGYRGDTKAEENAWQSNIVTLAAAWMPRDPRAARWLKVAKSYLVNTYTVPKDSTGPMASWITTQTLFPSFALENHGFYHPTYQMVAGMSLGDSYLMAYMLDTAVARDIRPFAEHNIEPVWKFLQRIVLDSGDLAFPSGLDWSLHSYEHVSYLAWLAAHFHDPQAMWAEPRLAGQILYRQAVNGDGRFVGESCPDGFYREAVEARRIAVAYLQNRIADFPKLSGTPPANITKDYKDAGLIVDRSSRTLTTVSYGPKTMALVNPLGGKNAAQRFLISPNTETLIGDAGKTELRHFTKTRTGFEAVLELASRKGRRSRMTIVSTPKAVVFLEVPADSSRLPQGGWLLSAIENDPLTGGTRTLYWQGDSVTIKDRSGASASADRKGWMNVDNWMGFVVPVPGVLTYQAPTGYNRNGSAEDFLRFLPENAHAPRAAILLPGMDAAQTARTLKHARWKTTRKKCSLVVSVPGQKRIRLKVRLN
jgi:hypothetical protein